MNPSLFYFWIIAYLSVAFGMLLLAYTRHRSEGMWVSGFWLDIVLSMFFLLLGAIVSAIFILDGSGSLLISTLAIASIPLLIILSAVQWVTIWQRSKAPFSHRRIGDPQ